MKTILFFVATLLYATFSNAQIDPQTPWTWMKGNNAVDQPGVYGTLGVPATANTPGSRNYSTTWRDAAGNLWLFGGSGFANGTSGYLNDLWKFEPLNNKWAWIKGDSSIGQYSIYGMQGTPGGANKPGGVYASVSWTDIQGNLWLFGGFGYTNDAFGFLNTLWKYNPDNNTWTWIKGATTINQAGIYGVKGVANNANTPGARYGSQTWTDASGNLWLFGGYGYSSTTTGNLNDIWKYNPNTNQWTWINGDNIPNQVGVYGTKGVASVTNKPGARYVSTSWKDEDDNVWLFGGYGYDIAGAGKLNDLWKYDPASNIWTWINGDKIKNQVGNYGEQGVSESTNKPGARYVSSAWNDISGEMWLFGGYGYDDAGQGYLNDLWKYNPITNNWTWVKGDKDVDQVSIYGTQGMADPTNKSGSRSGVSWTDGIGNLWLFGGYGFDGSSSGVLNDLWKINSSQFMLPLKLMQFSGILQNDVVTLKWQAEHENGFSHFIIQRSFDGVNFINLGNVNRTGLNGRHDYQYSDINLRNYAVERVFYRLQLMDLNGNSTYSKILRFDINEAESFLSVFPNPTRHTLTLSFYQPKATDLTIQITDMRGVIVKNQEVKIQTGMISMSVDVSMLPSSMYIITLMKGDVSVKEKFIKN